MTIRTDSTAHGPAKVPEISRLSFRPDRYDTVLLNGRPLADYLGRQSSNEDLAQLVFPVGLFSRADQAVATERLKRLSGFTPVLVCPDDMDMDCSVVSALVEERKGRIVWSSFAFGLDGEFGPVEAAELSFDKAEYLDFLKKYENRVAIAHLISRLGSKPPQEIDLAAELAEYGPEVAFNLLSYMVFDSARSRHWVKAARATRLRNNIACLLVTFLAGSFFIYGLDMEIRLVILIGILAALVAAGSCYAIWKPAQYEVWPPVFMTKEGFLVGWKRELFPWTAIGNYSPGHGEVRPSNGFKEILIVQPDGRLDYPPVFLPGSGDFDPDLSFLNVRLLSLISAQDKGEG